MRNRMVNLWTLGGLSIPDLLRRTARESWQDEVFGQGGRMAFYHFLAIFPSLLVFFLVSGRVPHLGDHMRNALQELSSRVLPEQVSQLLQNVMDELNQRARSGAELISVCAGGLWAALNGTWAMIYGLNKAYEVQEQHKMRYLFLPELREFLGKTGFTLTDHYRWMYFDKPADNTWNIVLVAKKKD